MHVTLIPAYGQDYTTAKAAKEAFANGKVWIIATYGHPYDGKTVLREHLVSEGATSVMLRFCDRRKTAIVKLEGK